MARCEPDSGERSRSVEAGDDEPGVADTARPPVEGQLYYAGLADGEQLPLCHSGAELGYEVTALGTGAKLLEDGRFVALVIGAQTLDQARVRLAFVQTQGPLPVLLLAAPSLLAAAGAAELPFDEGLGLPFSTQELSARLRSMRRLQAFARTSLGAQRLASDGRVAAGIAAELTGPLACVLSNLNSAWPELRELNGLAGSLRATDPGSALCLEEVTGQLHDLLSETREEVQRLVALVRDVRSFTAARQGVPRPCDLGACVESALSLLRTLVSGPIRVSQKLDPLPPVLAEPGQLIRLVVCLLLDAAGSVRPEGRITLRSREAGSLAVLEVEREGELPDAESVALLLQAAVPAPADQPAGFGLPLAASTARALGGDLFAQAVPGRAVKLVLRLPLAPQTQRGTGRS